MSPQAPALALPGSAPSTTCPVKTSCRKSGRLSFWSTTMISRSVGSSSVAPPRSSAKAFSCQCRAGGSGPALGGAGRGLQVARQHRYPEAVVLLPVQHGVEEDLPAEFVDGEDAQGLLIHPRPLDAVDDPSRLLLVRFDLSHGKQSSGPVAGGRDLFPTCPRCSPPPVRGCVCGVCLCLPAPGGGGCACGSRRR